MILEYHKEADTIELSKADKKQMVETAAAKRQGVAEKWIADQGWKGTVTIDPVEIPETEYLVLDPWKDVNEAHNLLTRQDIYPELVEAGEDGSWMRFTFDSDDVAEARKLIES